MGTKTNSLRELLDNKNIKRATNAIKETIIKPKLEKKRGGGGVGELVVLGLMVFCLIIILLIYHNGRECLALSKGPKKTRCMCCASLRWIYKQKKWVQLMFTPFIIILETTALVLGGPCTYYWRTPQLQGQCGKLLYKQKSDGTCMSEKPDNYKMNMDFGKKGSTDNHKFNLGWYQSKDKNFWSLECPSHPNSSKKYKYDDDKLATCTPKGLWVSDWFSKTSNNNSDLGFEKTNSFPFFRMRLADARKNPKKKWFNWLNLGIVAFGTKKCEYQHTKQHKTFFPGCIPKCPKGFAEIFGGMFCSKLNVPFTTGLHKWEPNVEWKPHVENTPRKQGKNFVCGDPHTAWYKIPLNHRGNGFSNADAAAASILTLGMARCHRPCLEKDRYIPDAAGGTCVEYTKPSEPSYCPQATVMRAIDNDIDASEVMDENAPPLFKVGIMQLPKKREKDKSNKINFRNKCSKHFNDQWYLRDDEINQDNDNENKNSLLNKDIEYKGKKKSEWLDLYKKNNDKALSKDNNGKERLFYKDIVYDACINPDKYINEKTVNSNEIEQRKEQLQLSCQDFICNDNEISYNDKTVPNDVKSKLCKNDALKELNTFRALKYVDTTSLFCGVFVITMLYLIITYFRDNFLVPPGEKLMGEMSEKLTETLDSVNQGNRAHQELLNHKILNSNKKSQEIETLKLKLQSKNPTVKKMAEIALANMPMTK